MSDLITTLKSKSDPTKNVYPNIKKDNIPFKLYEHRISFTINTDNDKNFDIYISVINTDSNACEDYQTLDGYLTTDLSVCNGCDSTGGGTDVAIAISKTQILTNDDITTLDYDIINTSNISDIVRSVW